MRRRLAIVALGLAVLGLAASQAPQNEPVTIRVDTTVDEGPDVSVLGLVRSRRTELHLHAERDEAAVAAAGAQPRARVHARAQPAHVRRREARAQVGLDQRLHRGCGGQSRLRLDDPRSHRRRLPGARHEAVRAARLHARGVVVRPAGRAVPALLEAWRSVQRHLHRLDLRAARLPEVGGTLLPGDAALRREVRPRRGRELVVRTLERARHRLLERVGRAGHRPRRSARRRRRRRRGATSSTSSTTSRSRACAAPCRRRGLAARK